MKINNIDEKEIEQIVNAVIDPENIVKMEANEINLRVLVQNMDKKMIEKCTEQIKEILTPLTSRYYGIWINNLS